MTTDPPGLSVRVTYDGGAVLPVGVGLYLVEAEIDDPNYQGSASGSLIISGLSFNDWQSDQFTPEQISSGEGEPTGDPDQDGGCNLAEFALGTDPLIKSELPKAMEEGASC